ncbi:hypothetical protein [Hoeflea sp.]|uniref:hypothetical protein n=1 Tax=Hoeflea sp. TaxID=1940281 RepID=UPI00199D489F|nr:hypothetical protein [Hoeflea sp.]MBC7282521.1 hypothetical protein [Hoeflea sp.]
MTDHPKTHSTERRLADIVREVKIASADRTDVVVDIRDADRARLELLAQEIGPLFDDIDPADDRFDFGISPGLQPRLWIDAVAHVHMGHDRRVYRFVRDTRLGRVTISDSSDMTRTADAVGRYIAERVIERERILAGDFEAMKASAGITSVAEHETDRDDTGAAEAEAAPSAEAWAAPADTGDTAAKPAAIAAVPDTAGQLPKRSTRGAGFVLGASWFILGCVAGAAALVVAFWDRISAMIN